MKFKWFAEICSVSRLIMITLVWINLPPNAVIQNYQAPKEKFNSCWWYNARPWHHTLFRNQVKSTVRDNHSESFCYHHFGMNSCYSPTVLDYEWSHLLGFFTERSLFFSWWQFSSPFNQYLHPSFFFSSCIFCIPICWSFSTCLTNCLSPSVMCTALSQFTSPFSLPIVKLCEQKKNYFELWSCSEMLGNYLWWLSSSWTLLRSKLNSFSLW